MALKVCTEPGCPELTTGRRCPDHTRARDKARGTRQARGYDKHYDKHRKREARRVATGQVLCWSCDTRISPLEPWDNGHCDNDRSIIHGAQHERCNSDTTTTGACTHISHVT